MRRVFPRRWCRFAEDSSGVPVMDPTGPLIPRAAPCRTGIPLSTLPDIVTTRIIKGLPVVSGLGADADPFAPAHKSPVWGLTTWFGRLGVVAVALVGILLCLPEETRRRLLEPRAGDTTLAAAGAAQAPGNEAAAKRFGVGSTKEQVRAIQGEPTRETRAAWWYGRAVVRFQNGRVVGWEDPPPCVLKAGTQPPR